ncbi:MAG: Spx/MgsR family RNA polymerase-binding regulatory protein [Chlamydiales bacterium]|nr:Spx/MgsR family RNA polymerase-binding regulatory protein [Chlamydiales bacterium]
MKMIIYVYSKCSTCQQALRFLEKKKIAVTIREIVEQPPSIEELQTMLDYHRANIKKLLNTSGRLYREMCLAEKLQEMTLSQILKLLSEQGMLVKRPFLLGDNCGLLGFKETEWSEALIT